MVDAHDPKPRWAYRPEGRADSMTVAGAGVAVLDHARRLVALDAKGRAGEPLALASALGSPRDPRRVEGHERVEVHDDAPIAARCAFPLGDAWLVSFGEPSLSLMRQGRKKGQPFAEGREEVTAVSVSLDGVALARGGSVELWTHAGKRKWAADPGGPYLAVALSGSTFVALSADGALFSLSVVTGEAKESLRLATTEPPQSWKLSLAGRDRVVLALGEHVVVVDAATMKVVRRVKLRGPVTQLAADAEGAVLGFADGFVQGVDFAAFEVTGTFAAHAAPLSALALSKDALYTTCGREVRAWDRENLGLVLASKSPITALSASGPLVVAGDRAGLVRVLSGDTEVARVALGQPITALSAVTESVVIAVTPRVLVRLAAPWKTPKILALRAPATAFAADATYAFVGTEDGAVDVYDLETETHVTRYSLSEADISALTLLPSGRLAVGTGALDGRVFVVDAGKAEVLHRVEAHDEAFGVTCLATEPRGRLVASGSDDASVALIDPVKGRVLAKVRLPETPASIAFEASGKRFVCTFADGKAAVVNLAERARVDALDVRGTTHVAWGKTPMFGHADGRVAAYPV